MEIWGSVGGRGLGLLGMGEARGGGREGIERVEGFILSLP